MGGRDLKISIQERDRFNAFVHLEIVRTKSNRGGELAGKKIAVKDNIAIKDYPLTCASNILKDYVSPYDATVIKRIRKSGSILLGHTNMDEFGMGSSCEYSIYGPVVNPHDRECVAGGSSGGSAAAVASGLADIALGSDTGGSVRQPAAFCGVYGFKPTYGVFSRYGLIAFSSSMDQIGILGSDTKDMYSLAKTISGIDEKDSTSLDTPFIEDSCKTLFQRSKIKIGIPKEYYPDNLHPDVKLAVEASISELKKMGCELVDVSLPHTSKVIPCYTVLSMAEASSNLARYDGGRYGLRISSETAEDLYINTRTEGLGPEVKRRILLGTYILSKGKYSEYYEKALRVRNLIRQDFFELFENGIDLILTPTTPTPAFKIGEIQSPVEMYHSDIFTASANLAGLPALNIPYLQKQLPVGVQLIAPPLHDTALFSIAEEMGELL